MIWHKYGDHWQVRRVALVCDDLQTVELTVHRRMGKNGLDDSSDLDEQPFEPGEKDSRLARRRGLDPSRHQRRVLRMGTNRPGRPLASKAGRIDAETAEPVIIGPRRKRVEQMEPAGLFS